MNDPILDAYLEEYKEREGLDLTDGSKKLDESYVFELFANFTVLARLYGTDAPLPDFSMGSARGIDGIAILVNNQFVDNEKTLEDISATSIEAEFVFTQVKRSASLDEGDMHKFCAAVRDFISGNNDNRGNENEEVTRMRNIRDRLFERSRQFTRTPTAKLYYIYTGKYRDNPAVSGIFTTLRRALVDESLYLSNLTFSIIDIDKLREFYRIVTRGTNKDLIFRDRVELPAVAGVKLAVLGFLPTSEYLNLITDEEGNLEQGIFYENVRAFLGNTKTNIEIANTLQSQKGLQQDWFPLLHNGVTIVARDVSQLGAKLSLRDLQVVNGCQSSNVLHGLRDKVGPNLSIPLKVIVTESTEITDSVIKGTNRQNEIKDEAFVAMESFQKGLEGYYSALAKQALVKPGLLYERRAHQYDDPSRPGLAGLYPVSIPFQIKSFVGMFSGAPHFAHRYYGQLLEQFGPTSTTPSLFLPDHRDKYGLYYVAAFFCQRIERLWVTQVLSKDYRPFKFLALDWLRLHLFQADIRDVMKSPPRVIEEKTREALSFWSENLQAREIIHEVMNHIESLFKQTSFKSRQNAAQSEDFTRKVQQLAKRDFRTSKPVQIVEETDADRSKARNSSVGTRMRGTLVREKATYGFIEAENGSEVFLHLNQLAGNSSALPPVGTQLTFEIGWSARGLRAENVQVLA